MSDELLRTFISVVGYLANLLVFLVAILASYFTLQQPRFRAPLGESSPLVRVVALVALSGLLASVGNRIVGDFMTLPMSLFTSTVAGFYAAIEFLGALASVGALTAACWFLLKHSEGSTELH